MLIIRHDQESALAKAHSGAFLARDFQAAGAAASWDASGNIAVSCVPGEVFTLALDDRGRVTRMTTPLGRTQEYVFDGRLLKHAVSTNGLTSDFIHDVQGRVSEARIGARHRYRFAYDDAGNLALFGFPDNTSLRMEYTDQQRLKSLTDRLGSAVVYDYDDAGGLISITDAKGQSTSFEYGLWNSPESILYPDGSVEGYEYSESGQLTGILSERSVHAECEHDDAGRLTEVRYRDGHFIAFAYGANGRVVEGANEDCTVTCEYDARGRLTLEDQSGRTVGYGYDPAGRFTSLTYPDGAQVCYEYDADGRLCGIRDWNGQRQTFQYRGLDVPLGRRLPNGLAENYTYNESQHLEAVDLLHATRPVWRQQYRRDLADRIVDLTDSRTGAGTYTYDAEGRVTSVARRPGAVERFRYDENGNRTEAFGSAIEYDTLNRPVRSARGACRYDRRGNRLEEQTAKGLIRYAYNAQDLLMQVDLPTGTSIRFEYDAFARRIRKIAGETTTTYVWAGHQMIAEIVEQRGAVTRREYLYQPGTHRPLALRIDGEVFHYHTDQLGTPQLLTDSAGRIVWSATFTLTGIALIDREEIAQPLRFPGQYFDAETCLHYNRARYYDPETGAYLSRDPAGLLAGVNMYWYADGDPINIADPLGCWGESLPSWAKTTISVAGAVVAAAAVGVAAVVLAPVAITTAVGAGIAIAVAGLAAGATGYGLNAAMTEGASVPCEMLRGAGVGLLASLPFVAFPFTTALAALAGLGGLSGGIGYVADWATGNQPWSTESLLWSVGIGAATAGLARLLLPRLAALRPFRRSAQAASPAAQSATDILMPGGSPVGRPGASAGIRRVNGGLPAAEKMFNQVAAGGKDVTPKGYPGKLVELPNGGRVGLRPVSSSADRSPSIDVNMPGIKVDKIHFEK